MNRLAFFFVALAACSDVSDEPLGGSTSGGSSSSSTSGSTDDGDDGFTGPSEETSATTTGDSSSGDLADGSSSSTSGGDVGAVWAPCIDVAQGFETCDEVCAALFDGVCSTECGAASVTFNDLPNCVTPPPDPIPVDARESDECELPLFEDPNYPTAAVTCCCEA